MTEGAKHCPAYILYLANEQVIGSDPLQGERITLFLASDEAKEAILFCFLKPGWKGHSSSLI